MRGIGRGQPTIFVEQRRELLQEPAPEHFGCPQLDLALPARLLHRVRTGTGSPHTNERRGAAGTGRPEQ
jgi:hypothetical protein